MDIISENKVLVISNNAFSKLLNNGKTYESIFKGWSKDNLAQLYFCTNEYPDFDFCNKYFKITEFDVLKSYIPFKINKVGRVLDISGNKLQLCHKEENKILRFIKRNAKTFAFFRDILWCSNVWKTKELINWIQDFNPEVIFFVGGDVGFTHDIVKWVSNEFKIPYVVYFTDDYVINQHSDNFLQKMNQNIIRKKIKKTILNASKCYAIGELMARDYYLKYKKTFSTLVNCIDFNEINYMPQKNSGKIIFSFIGGLHLNRWKSIVELGDLLHELKLPIEVEFNVYSIYKPEPYILNLLNVPPLSYKGGLNSSMVESKIQESDILVHVESFDKKSRIATKYSISTKIPEYLSSKRCVLGYGPNEVASIKLLSDNELGLVLTDLDSKLEKIEKIENLILDSVYRNRFIYNALKYSKEYFNADKMRIALRKDLKGILKNI